MNGMGINENDPYRWLKTKGMSVTERYSIENARVSIQTFFPLHGPEEYKHSRFRRGKCALKGM
jgi:hypothetical protein